MDLKVTALDNKQCLGTCMRFFRKLFSLIAAPAKARVSAEPFQPGVIAKKVYFPFNEQVFIQLH